MSNLLPLTDHSALITSNFYKKFQHIQRMELKKTPDDKDKLKSDHCGELETLRLVQGTYSAPITYVAADPSHAVPIASSNTFQQASSSSLSMMVLVSIMLKI